MTFSPGNGLIAAVAKANVVNSWPLSRGKVNASPVAEANCTAIDTQPFAQDARGWTTPSTVPPMNKSVTGVITGPEPWLVPSTNNVTLLNDSDCEVTRLGSSVTRKALPNWSVPK